MRKKNRLAGLLCIALLLLCAGCGAKAPAAPAEPGGSQIANTQSDPRTEPQEAGAAEPDAPQDEQTDYLAVYAPVLDETFDVLYNGIDDGETYQYVSTGVMEASRWGGARERIRDVGFRIEDISGDGVPELLIGTTPDEPTEVAMRGVIFGGYTWKGGEIVAFLDGWARNSYEWMGDGRFFNSGSGGAMYSIFATCRISADGTELLQEDYYFTHEKDESFLEIGFYHNTSGEWDTNASEELDISDDAFWAIMQDYEAQCVRLDLTPFTDYAYTGYVSQPLDCKVRADYLDDVAAGLSYYDDAADYFSELYPAGTAFDTTVIFQSEEGVADFKLLALEFRDVDESGRAIFSKAEVFSLPALRPGVPLAVPMSFPGDIPSSGFSYTDPDGTTRAFTLGVSGKDGSLYVAPLD